MPKNTTPLISDIHDLMFASSFIPSGILITKCDEHFTVIEANQGLFDMLGLSREEMRDIYQNRGFDTLHPEDRDAAAKSLLAQVAENQNGTFDVTCRMANKQQGYVTVQFRGRIAASETGEPRFYFSLMDISAYAEMMDKLQSERDFNTYIASLTENVFFAFDINSKTMRFSKNFADKLNIPDTIKDFQNSEIGKEMFGDCLDVIQNISTCSSEQENQDNELCIKLENGETVWYLYSYKLNCENGKCKIIGKMTDITNKKNELQSLKLKSELDALTGIYNRMATESYIKEFLQTNTDDIKCALFIIDLDNFKQINDNFGHMFGDNCLQEVANILKHMFRTADIVGRIGGDEFFVFVKDYKELKVIEEKAKDICKALKITYEQNGVRVGISSSVGICLYPQSAKTFETLYKKADIALYQSKNKGKNIYSII